jgi:hypothetical protein
MAGGVDSVSEKRDVETIHVQNTERRIFMGDAANRTRFARNAQMERCAPPFGGVGRRDQIYSVGFLVPVGATFDVWIDDISWIPAEPAP